MIIAHVQHANENTMSLFLEGLDTSLKHLKRSIGASCKTHQAYKNQSNQNFFLNSVRTDSGKILMKCDGDLFWNSIPLSFAIFSILHIF